MDAKITDAAALRRCTPAKVAAYLQTAGWKYDEVWQLRIAVWSKESDGRVSELLAPLLHRSETYDLRISQMLTTLAKLECRSQPDIYTDIINPVSTPPPAQPPADRQTR